MDTVFEVLQRNLQAFNPSEQNQECLRLIRNCVKEAVVAVKRDAVEEDVLEFLNRLLAVVLEVAQQDLTAPLFLDHFASGMLLQPVEEMLLGVSVIQHQLAQVDLDSASVMTCLPVCSAALHLSGLGLVVLKLLQPLYICGMSAVEQMCEMERRLFRVVLVLSTTLRSMLTAQDVEWLDSVLLSVSDEQVWRAVRECHCDGLRCLLLEGVGLLPQLSPALQDNLERLTEDFLSQFSSVSCTGLTKDPLDGEEALFSQLMVCVPALLRRGIEGWASRVSKMLHEVIAQATTKLTPSLLRRVFILATMLLESSCSDIQKSSADMMHLVLTLRDRDEVSDFLLDSADQLSNEPLLLCNAALARLLAVAADHRFAWLDRHYWDFALCNAVAWILALFDRNGDLEDVHKQFLQSAPLCQFAVQSLFLVQSLSRAVQVEGSVDRLEVKNTDETADSGRLMSAEDWKVSV